MIYHESHNALISNNIDKSTKFALSPEGCMHQFNNSSEEHQALNIKDI